MCPKNDGIADTEHFLLLCPSLAVPRKDLLAGVPGGGKGVFDS